MARTPWGDQFRCRLSNPGTTSSVGTPRFRSVKRSAAAAVWPTPGDRALGPQPGAAEPSVDARTAVGDEEPEAIAGFAGWRSSATVRSF